MNDQKSAEYAVNEIVPYFHDGAVLLLHAVSRDNTQALGTVIDAARAAGYEFSSLDDIPSEAQPQQS